MAKLKQTSREKIGIVVFILAIVGILIAVNAYLKIGHSFDLTASDIDENVGQLNDYVAVVFEGDNAPRAQKQQSTGKTLNPQTDVLDTSQQTQDEAEEGYHTEKATVKNVDDIYQEKGATTVNIRVTDYRAYENGEIIERYDWRVGVLSITQQTLDTMKNAKEYAKAHNNKQTPQAIEEFQKKIDNLRLENHASFVLLISPDQSVTEYVSKVDCVVARNVKDSVPDEGKNVNDVFVMRTPDTGIVGAIVSSPAKMMSASIYSKVEVKDAEE